MAADYDIAVIGGGIIGLATALALSDRHPELRLLLLEKEAEVGSHQTGHNSGVIHSGVYYRPGSLKARLCREGVQRLMTFCERYGVRYERPGKVIVATHRGELAALEALYRRGLANGVPGLRRITASELAELEPHATGLAALHVPGTGIVDFFEVARAMAKCLEERGVVLSTDAKVEGIRQDGSVLRLVAAADEPCARLVVNCAGLHADRVARMMGVVPEVQIVPFRGEYYLLRPERSFLVRGLIYPVPDARFPFLGVHLTRTVARMVEAGPNAVLALAREGYTKRRLEPGDLWQTVSYPGFLRLARRYWRTGLIELHRSLSKQAFVRAVRRLVPEVEAKDLTPHGAGVRAQAVDRNGRLVDDFSVMVTELAVHVLNAPSPGATASLAIGDHVAAVAARKLGLDGREVR